MGEALDLAVERIIAVLLGLPHLRDENIAVQPLAVGMNKIGGGNQIDDFLIAQVRDQQPTGGGPGNGIALADGRRDVKRPQALQSDDGGVFVAFQQAHLRRLTGFLHQAAQHSLALAHQIELLGVSGAEKIKPAAEEHPAFAPLIG